MRDDYHPALLFLRKYLFVLLVAIIILIFGFIKFRKTASGGRRFVILLITVAVLGIGWFLGWKVALYDYMQTYNAVSYTHLTLPTTPYV